MNSPSPSVDTPESRTELGIDYATFLSCVHCGLCTASCPTYKETLDENDSPRGRIYLMRSVADKRIELTEPIRRHLELCLDCRACETACPSGVEYGKLIEPFRNRMLPAPRDVFHRWILWKLFPNARRLERALLPARWASSLGLLSFVRATGLWKLLPRRLGRLVTLLPPLRKHPRLPSRVEAVGERRATVALFTGCVADALFRDVHWATLRVLQANGCDVIVPKNQACCGAIHYHSSQEEEARTLADQNVSAFADLDVDAVVVNVAGCGAMLKEYGHAWPEDGAGKRAQLAQKVRDVNEFLDELGWVAPLGRLPLQVTYHDACHLAHAQGVREAPRRLLERIPGLRIVPLDESDTCCGAAGSYNLTQTEMADRLARRKLQNILRTGARTVVSANAGCTLQILRQATLEGIRLRVVHPVQLLQESLEAAQQ